MKYIFVTGAPGSKWSSVCKNIYFSPDIDRSDYHEDRTYYHDAGGRLDLMHMGAYWDPGMEFGKFFDRLERYTKQECEAEFDRPFSGTGIRIIKSHVFANHIDFIKQHWPECPIVLVHRSDDACLGWWVKCGHFDITYPDYEEYYQNLREMSNIIAKQNTGIVDAIWNYKPDLSSPTGNYELCNALGIKQPPAEYRQNYASSDITVKVIL
jgi:hypothetical protein